MELLTPRLTLREFRASDWVAFRTIEAHHQTYFYESKMPDEERSRTYLYKALEEVWQTPRLHYCLVITTQPKDIVCGRVTLAQLNADIGEWEIGWAVHPDAWGRGYASEAANRLLGFAFSELLAHRVVAFSHAGNAASLRVMQKLGMQQEGYLRETRRWHGGWADEVIFSILSREWKTCSTAS